jgi:acyl-CoA thioesterase-1
LTWINEPSTPNGSVNRQPSTAPRASAASEHSYTVVVDVWRRLFVVSWLVLAGPLHAADRPTIVCFGDSITAGYGLAYGQAYSDFLQKSLDAQGYNYKIINRGTSGATTKDALGALPFVLRMHPAVVIVEFGGNDGLRGLPVEQSRNNLDQILTGLEKAHVKILLAGITLPPDYGPDYIRSFDQIFRDLAAKHHVAFIPMLYKNMIHVPGTIQNDGIHPTTKGSAIIADTLFPVLRPLLHKGP